MQCNLNELKIKLFQRIKKNIFSLFFTLWFDGKNRNFEETFTFFKKNRIFPEKTITFQEKRKDWEKNAFFMKNLFQKPLSLSIVWKPGECCTESHNLHISGVLVLHCKKILQKCGLMALD